ncbi:MAG TPA: FecR family protein [Candidatus Wallbacteria bacterium]|nr:FecR family protein [Candidatus Wallbacteria bacterium]
MEVRIMNCGEIRDFIIEYNGRIEGAGIKPEITAEINSHLVSCRKCALARERMLDMSAKIASDKVEIPANLASSIISKVIPAAEPAKPKIKTVGPTEISFIDKIAELFGISSRNFAFAMSAVVLAALAISLILYNHGLKSGGEAERIADSKGVTQQENIVKEPADKKFKKIENELSKNMTAANNEEIEKKFKRSIFTVESGAVANLTGEYRENELYQVKHGEDLVITYKKVAEVIIKTDSKFKVNDEGIILESGMVSVDLKPKSLPGFSVTTPESVVEVVGTIFSVASSNNKTEVIVKKGCVKVTDIKTKNFSLVNAGESKTVSRQDEVKSETAPVVIEYGSNAVHEAAKTLHANTQASTSEVSHTAETGTVPVGIDGANIKDVINKFKNENITIDK